MLNGKRVAVVLPAYNAAATLARTFAELDLSAIDEVLLVDDASQDETVDIAVQLGLNPVCHQVNRGYGANQKTCYDTALASAADIIVMLHPDYQYSARLVVPLAAMVSCGEYDLVLGSRILAQNAVRRGMPRYKYLANRFLTLVENFTVAGKLSEYHTGLRAYSRDMLLAIPYHLNSDEFVFDNQLILQALAAGARIGELSCPTRYEDDSSSISLGPSIRYGLGVLRAMLQYRLQRMGLRKYPYLTVLGIEQQSRCTNIDDAIAIVVCGMSDQPVVEDSTPLGAGSLPPPAEQTDQALTRWRNAT